MPSRRLLILALSVLPMLLFAAEKKARLHYTPDTPVYLESGIELEITQSLPGLSLATRGTQSIGANLTLNTDHPGIPVTQGPADLSFVLKALKIDLKANDVELHFDSKDTEPSLYLNQVSKMISRPIKIHLNENFQLDGAGPDLSRMARELPVLKEVGAECILFELLLHLFALGGEELAEGKEIQRTIGGCAPSSLPPKIDYTITKIDDYNVYASFKGNIEKQKFQLLGEVKIDDQMQEFVNVTLSGSMEGKGRWNRDNAMLHELEALYTYSAMFKLGKWEWLMNVSVKVKNRTANSVN